MLTKDDLNQLRQVVRVEIKEEVEPLHKRFDILEDKVDGLVARVGVLENKVDGLDEKIDKVQESVDIVQEVMVKHFGDLEKRVEKIEVQVNLPS